MKKLSLIILFLCVSPLCAHELSLALDSHFYLDNTEHFTDYHIGGSYVGAHASSWLEMHSFDCISFHAGIFFNHIFGDETIPTEVRPIIRFIYTKDKLLTLVFGNLFTQGQYGMLDALLMEQRNYTEKNKYGLSLSLSNRFLSYSAWANMDLLVTPEHREYIEHGQNFFFEAFGLYANAQFFVSHHGGQFFHTGVVSDNFSAALGIGYTLSLWRFELGSDLYLIGDIDIPDRNIPRLNTKGGGIYPGVYFGGFETFRVYAHYWRQYIDDEKNIGFKTEAGNPLFRIEGNYFSFGLKIERPIVKSTRVLVEARGHVFPIRGLSRYTFEYQYRLEFFHAFDLFLVSFETGETFVSRIKARKAKRGAAEAIQNAQKTNADSPTQSDDEKEE